MALFVGLRVEAERVLAVDFIGNDRSRSTVFQPRPQRGTIISLVADNCPRGRVPADQALRDWAIVRLATRQEDGKNTAPSIRDCVDLRIAPAA